MFTLWDVFWHECKVINFATNINIEITFLTHTHQQTDWMMCWQVSIKVFCFRARESDECFSAFGGFVSPRGNYNPFTQNLEDKELCRNLRKNSSHVCTRFYHKILGSFCTLRLTLQYRHWSNLFLRLFTIVTTQTKGNR